VIDDDGNKINVFHPGETRTINRVLGPKHSKPKWPDPKKRRLKISQRLFGEYRHPWGQPSWCIPKEILDERLGFFSKCMCSECGEMPSIDLQREKAQCPKCKSKKIKRIRECEGDKCPKCKKGKILKEERGMS